MTSASEKEKLLKEVVALGVENVRRLDEEMKRARASLRSAYEGYEEAKRTVGERFDTLAALLEEARAAALDALDASYVDQEQRLTFELSAAKAQRRSTQLAVIQAKESVTPPSSPAATAAPQAPSTSTLPSSSSTPPPLATLTLAVVTAAAATTAITPESTPRTPATEGRGRPQPPPTSPRKAGGGGTVGIAASDDATDDVGARLAHTKAALEVPVRHIRGIRVASGSAAPFDAVAALIRGLATDVRAEPADDVFVGRRSAPVAAAPVMLRPATMSYRANDRKFLVLSAAEEKRAMDVCGKIRGAVGRCVVDNVKANETLVSLDDLSGYDAVLAWVGGCTSFAGGPVLGSVLSQYVAAGGGVVVCPWALAIDEDGDGLRGEIVDRGLLGTFLGECISGTRLVWRRQCRDAMHSGGEYTDDVAETTAATECHHPVMAGVRYIDGGVYSGHHSIRIAEDRAGLVECAAMWDDGTPLALVNKNKSATEGGRYTTAVINLYPVSADCSVRCWDTSTDFAILLANALHLVSRRT
jgi:hypothetical protein